MIKIYRSVSLLSLAGVVLLFSAVNGVAQPKERVPDKSRQLKVSANKHYLVKNDGTPFFYLGDTAWELFHRLNREEADRYLEDRMRKGFTVIQAVALAELNGHKDPNAYGHLPLIDLDPGRPAVKAGEANDYWDHVDYIVSKANDLGLYIGFLPTWGKYWHGNPEALFTTENAEAYGEWLGKRYRNKDIIWILGGDRPVENDLHREIIKSMANGLRKGDGGRNLITFHPRGGEGSAQYFHDETWLDFNMRQNGHIAEFSGNYLNRVNDKQKDYGQTRFDYDRTPTKPVIDGEPLYEDHPLSFSAKELGHSIASDVRRHLYWNLFNGALGHTYGHHSIWQMWTKDKNPVNAPLMPWYEALDQPGSGQMQYGRRLIESRPFLTRIPDDQIIVTDRVPTSVPGVGRYKFVATRDSDGTYAMVYAPVGREFRVHMDVIKGEKVKAWWYNPRKGEATEIGIFDSKGERSFTPPDKGEAIDWVLVLDDVSKKYSAPGS